MLTAFPIFDSCCFRAILATDIPLLSGDLVRVGVNDQVLSFLYTRKKKIVSRQHERERMREVWVSWTAKCWMHFFYLALTTRPL
jgi:hypothetical protein